MATDLARVPSASDGADRRRVTAQCVELVRGLRRQFRDRDELHAYTDAVIHGEVPISIPKGFRKISRVRRIPLANHFVSTITAALTVDEPRVSVPLRGAVPESAQANSTLREHFFNASWSAQEDEADEPLFRRFVRPVVAKGEGVIKTVERSKSLWAAYSAYSARLVERMTEGDLKRLDNDAKDRLYHHRTEEYKAFQVPYPICSVDVPPDQYYYWKGDNGTAVSLEHKRVPYLETLLRYGASLDADGRILPKGAVPGQAMPAEDWGRVMSGVEAITLSEVWLPKECIVLASGPGQSGVSDAALAGTVLRRYPHRYGNPYTNTLRGPYFHCRGATTESRLPDKAGMGVLYGYLDLFVWLNELLSIQQVNAIMTGLAAYKRNRPPPGSGLPETELSEDGLPRPRQPVTLEPGTVFDDDIGPVEQPVAGRALGETIAMVNEALARILPNVLQGIVDTTDSGYQLAQAVRLGRIAFDPIVKNIQRCMAKRVAFESRLIEECVGETVYVEGDAGGGRPKKRGSSTATVLSIGPEDLNGVHRYRVTLSPDATNEELIDVRKHAEMVKNGFESTSEAQEALGKNPEETERKIYAEQAKAWPEVQAQLKQRVLEKLAVADQQRRAAAEAALGGPVGAPGDALQGMGQVFEPGQAGMPIEPTVPGGQVGVPASPPGAPGGIPATQMVAGLPGQPAPGM